MYPEMLYFKMSLFFSEMKNNRKSTPNIFDFKTKLLNQSIRPVFGHLELSIIRAYKRMYIVGEGLKRPQHRDHP
jgi:hypothetical protein